MLLNILRACSYTAVVGSCFVGLSAQSLPALGAIYKQILATNPNSYPDIAGTSAAIDQACKASRADIEASLPEFTLALKSSNVNIQAVGATGVIGLSQRPDGMAILDELRPTLGPLLDKSDPRVSKKILVGLMQKGPVLSQGYVDVLSKELKPSAETVGPSAVFLLMQARPKEKKLDQQIAALIKNSSEQETLEAQLVRTVGMNPSQPEEAGAVLEQLHTSPFEKVKAAAINTLPSLGPDAMSKALTDLRAISENAAFSAQTRSAASNALDAAASQQAPW